MTGEIGDEDGRTFDEIDEGDWFDELGDEIDRVIKRVDEMIGGRRARGDEGHDYALEDALDEARRMTHRLVRMCELEDEAGDGSAEFQQMVAEVEGRRILEEVHQRGDGSGWTSELEDEFERVCSATDEILEDCSTNERVRFEIAVARASPTGFNFELGFIWVCDSKLCESGIMTLHFEVSNVSFDAFLENLAMRRERLVARIREVDAQVQAGQECR